MTARRQFSRLCRRSMLRTPSMAEATDSSGSSPFAAWGRALTAPVVALGELTTFFVQSILAIFRPPFRVAALFTQLDFMSFGSLFVVGLTGLFTGMVLALQTIYAFGLF